MSSTTSSSNTTPRSLAAPTNSYNSDPAGAVASSHSFQVDIDAVIAQNTPSPVHPRRSGSRGDPAATGNSESIEVVGNVDILQSSFHSLTYEDTASAGSHNESDRKGMMSYQDEEDGPGSGAQNFLKSMVPKTTKSPSGHTYVYCGNPSRFWRCVGILLLMVGIAVMIHWFVKPFGGGRSDNNSAAANTVDVPVPPPPPTGPAPTPSPVEDVTVKENDDEFSGQDIIDQEENDQDIMNDEIWADGLSDDDCLAFGEDDEDIHPFLQCYCAQPPQDSEETGRFMTNSFSGVVEGKKAFLTANLNFIAPELSEGLMAMSCTPQNMALWWTAMDLVENDLLSEIDILPIVQRYTMAYLYGVWNGDNWFDEARAGWVTSASECDWTGVECTDFGKVAGLTMEAQNLVGPIPSEISLLSATLRVLELSDNLLSGSLPTTFYDLSELITLKLGMNKLTGTLPAEIAEMRDLTVLELKRNDFTSTIPTEYGLLVQLVQLKVEDNELTGIIPSDLMNLHKLTSVSFSDNKELGGTIPYEIDQWKNLQELSLHDTAVYGTIPPTLGLLTALMHLRLDDNELNGPIPTWMGDLVELTFVDLRLNDFTGAIPTQFGKLSKLELLGLSNNVQLVGPLPSELSRLTALTSAHFAFLPSMTGTMPLCDMATVPETLVADCSVQLDCACCSSHDLSETCPGIDATTGAATNTVDAGAARF